MPKGFLKGNTLGQAPAPEGSPKRKLAAPQKPFNAEQQLYVNSLLEFREINHWFPYESTPREIAPGCEHIATIAKVMNISHNHHRRIVKSHPKLSHGYRGIIFHLRELGFVDISENNLEMRSINGVKIQWVNFHKEPKGCPMDVLKMQDTRVTHWSRCLALRVGRFDEDIGGEEDALSMVS